MEHYILTTVPLNLLLAIIWRDNNMFDILLKMYFIIMSAWSLILSLKFYVLV